ncbi:MAG: isocitrate lyase/phosphoenolpyruvate mutase family protein [Alphaproteobacteria bacterium]|nr:isocitrate lyase/phosphoenolpyruvate mutase family protein [Alphaproteobacteria bacterium]
MTARPDDAKTFHGLHKGPALLLLPNAWDAQSARIVEDAGAKAIATSSAAVAWSHGYADGHFTPMEVLTATVREMARVVRIPISVDMERGYSDEPSAVGENVRAIIGAGGIGMNMEDSTLGADLLCRKIEAVKRAAAAEGVDFFVNARCDVYLRKIAEGDAAQAESIVRAAAYRNAGADGFFLPGPTDNALFQAVAGAIGMPLNVMARPGVPGKAALEAAGVRRLSAATALSRGAYNAAKVLAEAFLRDGDGEALSQNAGPAVDFNAWFRG